MLDNNRTGARRAGPEAQCIAGIVVWLASSSLSYAQGLIVNEVSNGPAGNQEYIELVAIGSSPGMDFTNWIIDDNNGDYGSGSGQGIAGGYMQIVGTCLSDVDPGSIILFYNDSDPGDKNPAITLADDPSDSNGDGVYVIPSTDPCVRFCASPPSATNSSYDTATCTETGDWENRIAFANAGDAAQVRQPDGSFFHGISYGSLTPPADPTLFNIESGTGGNRVYYFTCGDYSTNEGADTNPVYFRQLTSGTPGETPGAENQDASGANATFITLVTDGDFVYTDPASNCDATTPVTLTHFQTWTEGRKLVASWSTATEAGNVGFDLYGWSEGTWLALNDQLIPSAVVDSTVPQHYEFVGEVGQISRFLLTDIDIRGRTTRHGPFDLGQQHGRPSDARTIDWPAISAEHLKKRNRARTTARRQPTGAGSVKLIVSTDGIQRLTYSALLTAGIDLAGLKAKRLSLSLDGVPVPMLVTTQHRNGAIDSSSTIDFLGKTRNSLYGADNAYVFSVGRLSPSNPVSVVTDGPADGANDELPSVEPARYYLETAEVQRQRHYSFVAPGTDPWYDDRLLAYGERISRNYDVALTELVDGIDGARIEVGFWGATTFPQAPDHHVVIDVNGRRIADDRFDGLVAHTVQAALPTGVLLEGVNTLTVALPGDTGTPFDLVNLDGYSVRYPRAFVAQQDRLSFTAAGALFAIDGFTSENVVVYGEGADGLIQRHETETETGNLGYRVRFAGSESVRAYHASSESALALPRIEPIDGIAIAPIDFGPADYVVIAHGDFINADLQRLVTAREADGLRVKVVDVESIYAQYGEHQTDPRAIRAYIAYAHENLDTEYVLLVGGDTYDYHDYLGLGAVSFLPSLYAATGDIVRYAPVDALYADVDRDNVPDLAIGRLPVRSSDELRGLVDQTLRYGQKFYGHSAVFAADAYDSEQGYDFQADSESLLAGLPLAWQVERAYVDELGTAGARQTLIDAINRGVALTSFFGHSGPSDWTFGGLFRSADAAALSNADRPTVVTQWGCWNTYYVQPQADTLGHRFLLAGNRGAAAVLGASTLTSASAEAALAGHLIDRLVTPGMTLGRAVVEAKRSYSQQSARQIDVILGWTLLGDPALVIEP